MMGDTPANNPISNVSGAPQPAAPSAPKARSKKNNNAMIIGGAVLGLAVIIAVVVLLMNVMGSGKKLSCSHELTDIFWTTNEETGQDVTYSYGLKYDLTFKNDVLESAEVSKTYTSDDEAMLKEMKAVAESVSSNEYAEKTSADLNGKTLKAGYTVKNTAFNLSPKEYDANNVKGLLDYINGYFEYDEDYNPVYKVDNMKDFLKYDTVKEALERNNMTCN